MSGFYDRPSTEQVMALQDLAVSALGAWDLGAVEAVDLVAERENAVFAVTTDRGRFAVRVHRAGYHGDDELRSQVAWMRALRHAGVVDTADCPDTGTAGISDDNVITLASSFPQSGLTAAQILAQFGAA